jgi:hypothetical protein
LIFIRDTSFDEPSFFKLYANVTININLDFKLIGYGFYWMQVPVMDRSLPCRFKPDSRIVASFYQWLLLAFATPAPVISTL